MVDTTAWNQGIINAQALGLGELIGENDKLNETIEAILAHAAKEITELRNGQQTYQQFLAQKGNGDAVHESLEIFGAVRPDQLAEDASLGAKRVMNLKLFAWSEWFQQTLHGQLTFGTRQAPILRHLSQAVSENDGKIENPEATVSALNDIAARMEFSAGMDNGHEWVEDRIHEMAKSVEWQSDDPTIPVESSIKQVVPNLVDYEKRTGETYEPFKENMYGINNMAAR